MERPTSVLERGSKEAHAHTAVTQSRGSILMSEGEDGSSQCLDGRRQRRSCRCKCKCTRARCVNGSRKEKETERKDSAHLSFHIPFPTLRNGILCNTLSIYRPPFCRRIVQASKQTSKKRLCAVTDLIEANENDAKIVCGNRNGA
mmetsp:Transcript_1912/g.4708  ORF Transcript_1912/g.4708 Transcript_1912/m.4708 type:complete len:145 (+) Transcript_1912:1539-1973(+)